MKLLGHQPHQVVEQLMNQCFENHLFSDHWGTEMVESQINQHV